MNKNESVNNAEKPKKKSSKKLLKANQQMIDEIQHSADEGKRPNNLEFKLDAQKNIKFKKSKTLLNARSDSNGHPIKKGGKKHRIKFKDNLVDIVNITHIKNYDNNSVHENSKISSEKESSFEKKESQPLIKKSSNSNKGNDESCCTQVCMIF